MPFASHARFALLPALLMIGAQPSPVAAQTTGAQTATALARLDDYARQQRSTGLIVIQNGKTLFAHYWPAPQGDPAYALFVHETAPDGELFEDVASQQKSFVSVLMAIAIDKGLLDVNAPVSHYLGTGWSKATAEQEAQIRVIDVLTMSTGLDEKFNVAAPSGTRFFYNTPVYAMSKAILTAATHRPLEDITRDWLTGPLGMAHTAWRVRPQALASVGNLTGLVTTPGDTAIFGQMILAAGVAKDGKRLMSKASFDAMFTPSANNPAYGRLWWLNGSRWTIGALTGRREGPLVKAAPADMVGALGFFDRRLYVVPSQKLVIVRTGDAALDKDFDEQLWQRLNATFGWPTPQR